MKMIIARAALVAAPALLLGACGSTDEADAPAEADNVEMPAAEVMAQPGMEDDAAVDAAAADVFPALAGYVKNTDAAQVDERAECSGRWTRRAR